ncbi:MAG: LysR family transcriptional regulator [Candidatus Carbobacillus altaicus]|nr:LysR family transcriptional regulator [Candidatus Carbobacillus altaicus]
MFFPLEVFVTVYELKNFTRAAEKLYLTQPAVSGQIQQLEQTLGVQLFIRSPRKVQPTAAGEVFYTYAKRILAEEAALMRELDVHQRSLMGSLRIGASYTIGEAVLPSLISQFVSRYPQVELEVMVENSDKIMMEVCSGEIDLGLIEGMSSKKELVREDWLTDVLSLIVPPHDPLTKRKTPPKLKELEDRAWVIREEGSGTRAFLDDLFLKHHFTPKRKLILSSNTGIKEAVMNDLGISILSQYAVAREALHGDLALLPLADVVMERPFSLIYRPHHPSLRLEVFLDFARSWVHHIHPGGVKSGEDQGADESDEHRFQA